MPPRRFDTIESLPHEPPFSAALLDELSVRGLHCGSSRQLRPGWVNTDRLHLEATDETKTEPGRLARVDGDLLYLEHDSREGYPFEDASFDWAYAEHFLEHLELEHAIGWLAEIRRLLKPGGHVRLTTPDLRLYAEGYVDPESDFFAQHRAALGHLPAFAQRGVPERPAWMINQIFYKWRHKWIFDFEEIRFAAEQAGFDPAAVSRHSFQQGSVPEVAAMDLLGHIDETIYVEVTAS